MPLKYVAKRSEKIKLYLFSFPIVSFKGTKLTYNATPSVFLKTFSIILSKQLQYQKSMGMNNFIFVADVGSRSQEYEDIKHQL